MALDGALHDWLGKRAGLPVWRLLGVRWRRTPQTSYTIGIDTVEGTADKTRRAQRYGVLKVKVGGADDLARLRGDPRALARPLRIDGNEGWTLETARELMPALVELGVEFVEQPFPAERPRRLPRAARAAGAPPGRHRRGLQEPRHVAPIATYADGVNIKLAKCRRHPRGGCAWCTRRARSACASCSAA